VWQVKNGGSNWSNGSTVPGTDYHYALKAWALFGTGQVGTTTGDGNRDVMVYSDGTHPTAAASAAYAQITLRKIRDDLANYIATGARTVD
jgi:hypothetical protein